MLKGMCDIPLRNLARNGTDNEVSLSSAACLSALRVSHFALFLTFFCSLVKILTGSSLQTSVICQRIHDVTVNKSLDLAKARARIGEMEESSVSMEVYSELQKKLDDS